jgi:iron(III) transport system substrate-binding protein
MKVRRFSQRMTLLVATASLAATVAACGSSPTKGADSGGSKDAQKLYDTYNKMSQADRDPKLYDEAKKEGKLQIYGSPNSDDATIAAFEKKYPGIKIEHYGADTEEAEARFAQEEQAGRHTADFLENNESSLVQADALGLLGDYESDRRDQIPDYAKGPGWTGNRRVAYVAGYNTDQVQPSDLPADFLGFEDPKWKGKLSMEIGDWPWYMQMAYYYMDEKGMTEDQVKDAFEKIAANATTAKGHTDQGTALAAGQVDVTMSSFGQTIDRLIATQAPVAWGGSGQPAVQPIVVDFTGGAVNKFAPHPAAAMLFMDFTLSEDAVPALAVDSVMPPIPEANDPLNGLAVVYLDPKKELDEADKWSMESDEIIQHAGQ